MVRNYVRKKEDYSEETVKNVLKLLAGPRKYIKKSFNKNRNFPVGTLHRYKSKQAPKQKTFKMKRGRAHTLDGKTEKRLVTVIKTAGKLGWPLAT